ncbi:hypothetical protein AJ79_04034 [Helicocarpus griseus UAMH5409]|uniref:HTH psq-type domain-containing protein n=1 Tax=Helicocarpus griseus UAMH5409 TaxID=1447875 RepID=A0A2B7XUY3_9EURO|nr:hypothetical protein AJ79_04034 [Helicocarpus griseus UAMH5409]
MVNEEAIQAAIEVLKTQLVPEYADVAKEFNVNQITLMRRFKGQQMSVSEAASTAWRKLSDSEEQQLLYHINCLSE